MLAALGAGLPRVQPAAADDAPAALTERIGAILNEPRFKPTHWGLLICDLADGAVIYQQNADKLFAPASTTKLFTVAAAWDEFGPDYRWETKLARRGDIDDAGRLAGDLILVAGGDLNLGGRIDEAGHVAFTNVDHTYADGHTAGGLTPQDPLAGLMALAQQAHDAGLRSVEDVLIDDRLFERAESTGSGPTIVTPILVNDNLIDLIVTPTEPGQPARVEWRPRTALYGVAAQVETAASDAATRIEVTHKDESPIEVRGKIAAGRDAVVRSVSVPEPQRFARALLIECLAQAGVACQAGIDAAASADRLPPPGAYSTDQIVARLASARFAEEAKLILKVSHNLHASTLPLLVAAAHGKRTLAEGLRLEREFLLRIGVDADSISFGGGAGGARSDSVTPRATVQLLRAMAARPDFAEYRAALPVLGVDGTLADSVSRDSPVRGKAFAKTGTYYWQNHLSGRYLLLSKALAGYLEAASGRSVAFAFFMNNVHLDKVEDRAKLGQVLGRLCEIAHEEL